jgi:hypothetical protein
MRAFKAITQESRHKYHTLVLRFMNYLLNVYYADLKSKGKAAGAPKPDLTPI